MTSITTQNEVKHINWLQKAFDAIPNGEVKQKLQQISNDCECSVKTFYRWKQKGFVPKQRDLVTICNALNLDVMTRKPKNEFPNPK